MNKLSRHYYRIMVFAALILTAGAIWLLIRPFEANDRYNEYLIGGTLLLTLNGEETDASDITLPSGTIYNFNEDDLNAYASSCDLEGFLARLEDIFGDGLTEQFA